MMDNQAGLTITWLRAWLGAILLAIVAECTTAVDQLEVSLRQNSNAQLVSQPELLTFEQLRDRIAERVQNQELVRIRPTWPETYQIRARMADLTDLVTRERAVLQILSPAGRVLVESDLLSFPWFGHPDPTWKDPTFGIPWSCVRDDVLQLRYRIAMRSPVGADREPLCAEGDLSMPVIVVESVEQVMMPMSSVELTDVLAKETKIDLVKSGNGHLARINFPDHRMPNDVSFAIQLIVLCQDRIIGHGYCWCDEQCSNSAIQSNLFVPLDLDWAAASSGAPIHVMVRGSVEYALRDIDRKIYWADGFIVQAAVYDGQRLIDRRSAD